MSEWRNFGPVEGVFWIGRLGIAFRTAFVFSGYRNDELGVTAYRFWPFVFLWVDYR